MLKKRMIPVVINAITLVFDLLTRKITYDLYTANAELTRGRGMPIDDIKSVE